MFQVKPKSRHAGLVFPFENPISVHSLALKCTIRSLLAFFRGRAFKLCFSEFVPRSVLFGVVCVSDSLLCCRQLLRLSVIGKCIADNGLQQGATPEYIDSVCMPKPLNAGPPPAYYPTGAEAMNSYSAAIVSAAFAGGVKQPKYYNENHFTPLNSNVGIQP